MHQRGLHADQDYGGSARVAHLARRAFYPRGIVWSFGWFVALALVSDWLTRNVFGSTPGSGKML